MTAGLLHRKAASLFSSTKPLARVDVPDPVRYFVVILRHIDGDVSVEQGHAVSAIQEIGFGVAGGLRKRCQGLS